jgi:hypothetical protein
MDTLNAPIIENLKEVLIGKSISAISVMMITPQYLEPEEGHAWICNGGVELDLEDKKISITFHDESNTFHAYESPLEPLLDGYDYYNIDDASQSWLAFKDLKIIDVVIKYSEIHEVDYTGAVTSSVSTPIEFILYLENDVVFQLAVVNYKLDVDSGDFEKIWYDLEGDILVSVDLLFEIDD